MPGASRSSASNHRKSAKMAKYIRIGLLSGLLVGGTLYIAENTTNSFFGAISIPLSLASIYYLEERKVNGHAQLLTVSLLVYALATGLFYFLVAKHRVTKKRALVVALGLWFFITCSLYLVYNR